MVDRVRFNVGATGVQALEEVAVRTDAQPLVPGVVFGFEMGVVGDVLGQLSVDGEAEDHAREPGEFLAEDEENARGEDPADALDLAEPGRGQEEAEQVCVAVREGEDVGWAALEHGDPGRLLGHLGEESDGRGATADDHDLLVFIVEVFGPELGVDCLALEIVDAGDGGLQRSVVVVVTGAEDDEARGVGLLVAIVVHVERPDVVATRPVGGPESVAEEDVGVDAVLLGGILHVLGDGGALGNGVVLVPRVPGKTKGEEIRVRPDAGIAEQIPGTSNGVAGLEDGIGVAGQFTLDSISGIDTGDTTADDDDVEGTLRLDGRVAVHDDRRTTGGRGRGRRTGQVNSQQSTATRPTLGDR